MNERASRKGCCKHERRADEGPSPFRIFGVEPGFVPYRPIEFEHNGKKGVMVVTLYTEEQWFALPPGERSDSAHYHAETGLYFRPVFRPAEPVSRSPGGSA